MLTTSERPSDVAVITPLLTFLWLEITGKCNLSCQHCYAGSSPAGHHGAMRCADWEQVITEAAELGCQRMQFIGGEPSVYPHLAHLIRIARNLGIQIEVYTNLVAIKPMLWETFQDCQVSIATSFYTYRPDIHEQITQGHQSFERTVKNIKQVVELGLPLRVGLIEIRPDQDIAATKQFLQDLGIRRIGVDQTRGVGRGSTLIQVAQPEDALCGACARGKAAVVPSGDVYPCVFSRHLRIGNVRERSFTQIITGETMATTRDQLNAFFTKKFPRRSGDRKSKSPCQPDQGPCSPDKSCMPDTAAYLITQDLTALNAQQFTAGVCEPDDCEPFCEPWECNPDIPPCQPHMHCIPDWKPPCSPATPCKPDEEQCPPDWDPPKR